MSDEDPIRADVERRLRALADVTVLLPITTMRSIDACVRRRIDSARDLVQRPVRLLQSLFDVVTRASSANDGGPSSPVIDVDESVAPEPSRLVPDPSPGGGAPADLPIEAYESLAASHVVARLEALSPSELRRVREFEAAHRGRRTVLGKIDQLLG